MQADAVPAAAAALPAGTDGDAAWAAQARETLAQADARLARRFDAGEPVERLVALRARTVDAIVAGAWRRCLPDGEAGLALFAVGGYGRGELYPQSDVDLLVLAEAPAQRAQAGALARLHALLWDAGLAASQALRSAQECTAAAADQTVLTALLEARPLQADAAAVAALQAAIAPERVWPARDFFLAKREEQRLRHARFGDTSDNLEPNLKDGPGGLRDLHTLGWLALRSFGVRELGPLVALGHLGADEAQALERERQLLMRLRFGLHLVAGRREERLRFDHQKALAARLGYRDDADALGVEQMMQAFYCSAAVVRRIDERLLQRFEEHFEGSTAPEPIDADFERRRGYLAVRRPDWLAADPAHVFALFAAWAADPGLRGLHTQTARALAQLLPEIPAYEAAPAALRARFMDLLRGPQPVRTLERMARLGVLGRWIPAFARVSGRMQFDLFHVYTVDQHTLMVLRNLEGFAGGQPDPRFSIAHDVWPRLRKPELLLLAGLFHDIAKGRGGDHSELGAVDARAFCAAHGLSPADTALVAWLVQKHLLMSMTAQKQDIADPDVIHRFAAQVGDRERLDLLYLLTCADIAGTSPKLWNAWKDRLLADLYNATRQALRRGLEHPVAAAERAAEVRAAARAALAAAGVGEDEQRRLLALLPAQVFMRSRAEAVAWQALQLRGAAPGELRVAARALAAQSGALEVFVRAPDRDGLFAAIVATLDRLGLAIQRARLLDAPGGTVVDSFELVPADGQRGQDPEAVAQRLREVLAGADLDRVRPARRAPPRHLKHFRIAPRIEFGDAEQGRTQLSLVCTDRPGLLADISRVLREAGLRVHDARIATFGERAEDLFQISDQHDAPLRDESRRQALRRALLAVIDGDPT
ncbi:[protein-PII] uridylyltransferase [Thermomonas flagellata]|uniref:[protein-PII] uridylyltransferase n=1 Tax=Thermomonas flagellata TaxID=2888524 RepID=UPI001F0477D2|nr:[protein-PII] uridylyltransferase [Thermomonas flagellata]